MCKNSETTGESIFITTLNKTLSSWFIAIIAAEYITEVIPCGTHEWNKFIASHDVQRILNNYNCQTKLIRGIKGLPFRGQRSWTSSTAVCYAFHAVKQKETDTVI